MAELERRLFEEALAEVRGAAGAPAAPQLLGPGASMPTPVAAAAQAPRTQPSPIPPREPTTVSPSVRQQDDQSLLGEAFEKAGWLLDVGNKYVTRPALGWLAKQLSPYEEVRQAPSYTEAWNLAAQGHPWAKFLVEAVLDPLNLVGVGLVGKAAKVPKVARMLEWSPALARTFDVASAADELAGRVMALPVTVPFRGLKATARGLERITGKPLFQKSPSAQVREKANLFREALKAAESRGLPDLLTPEGDIARVARVDIANRLKAMPREQVRAALRNLDGVQLTRAWDGLSREAADDPGAREALVEVRRELLERGLMQETREGNRVLLKPSERMRAHLELDDALLTREFPEEARGILHRILDALAVSLFAGNPEKFRDLDEVYGMIRVRPAFEDPAEEANRLFQTVREVAQKMLDDPHYVPEHPDEELVQDAFRMLGLTPDASRVALERLRLGNRELGPTKAREGAIWYRDAGAVVARLFPRGVTIPEESIRRLADPANVDPEYKRMVFLSSREASALNEFLKARGVDLGSKPIPESLFNEFAASVVAIPDPPYRGKKIKLRGVIKMVKPDVPVNPLLDQARVLGLTRADKIDPRLAAELGIDLRNVDELGFLVPEEASKLVAHLLRRRDLRDLALAAWAAGGRGQDPKANLRAVAAWPELLMRGVHAGGQLFAGYDEYRRFLLMGLPGLYAEKAFSHNADFSEPILRRVPDLTRLVEHPGRPSPYVDKILNYTWIVQEYADLFDEAVARLRAGVPEEEVARWFSEREKQIDAAALDRWIRREIYSLTGVPFEQAVKLAGRSAEPEDAVAERVFFRSLWDRVREDPELRRLYPNFAALQAGVWQIARLEGKGVEKGLGEVVRQLLEGRLEGFRKLAENWDLWMPSEIVSTDETIRQILSQASQRGLLRDEATRALIDALYPRLYQALKGVRGYLELGPEGPVIFLTPKADITTLPHELAHLLRYVARGAGVFAGELRPAEEGFARGFERLLATGEAPEAIREPLERYRRIAEVAYRRGLPREELSPEVARQLLEDLSLPSAPVPRRLQELLRSGDYVVLTSDKTGLPEEELARRRQQLLEDLRARGYREIIPVRGRYSEEGVVERSFMVPGMREQDALELGAKYGQESVLVGNTGLVYTTGPHAGRVVSATGLSLSGPERLYFSEVDTPEGTVKFSVRLDDGQWPSDAELKVVPGTALPAVPEAFRQAEQAAQASVRRERALAPLREELRPRSPEETTRRLREVKRRKLSYEAGDPNPTVGGRKLFAEDGKGPLDANPRLRGALFDKAARRILEGRPWGPGIEEELGRVGADGKLRPLSRRELAHLEWMLQKAGLLTPEQALEVRAHFPGTSPLPQRIAETPAEAEEAVRLVAEAPGATMRPLAGEQLSEVLSQIAAEERLPTQHLELATRMLSQTFGDDNAPLAAVSLWLPSLRPRVVKALSASTEKEARDVLAGLLREVGDTWAAFGVRFPTAQLVIERLLPRVRKLPKSPAGALARSWYGSALPDELVQSLREARALPRVQKAEAAFQQARQALLDVAGAIRQREPLAPDLSQETATLRDVMRLREFATDNEKRAIDGFLDLVGVKPEKAAEAMLGHTFKEARREHLVAAYAEEMEKRLGVKRDTGVVKALQRLAHSLPLRAWREQALLTPRYHAQNILDSTVKAALYGVNPLIGRSAFTVAERLGISIPDTVLWRPQTLVWEEFASPEAESALGTLLGRVSPRLGQGAERLIQFNRRVAQAVESSFRSAAWLSETLRALKEAKPDFAELVRQTLDQDVANRVLKGLDATEHGVVFSPEQLREAIMRSGGSAEQAAELSAAWGRLLGQASAQGEALARRLFFDYGDERNIERWLGVRAWAPFHFWATRNVPFYLETLAQHPWLLRAWESYHQIAEEERERLGLPQRFTGTMPVPFLGLLFGPGTAYVNPLVALSIADQLKYRYIPEETPLLVRFQEEASRFGLGLAPWVELPLGALGLLGSEWEPMRVLRHSGLVAQATGVDIEEPLRRGIRRLQGKGPTLTGSDYTDYLVRKRILELSVEETGRAAHPEYVAALADPVSPIFQRAWADVRRQLLGQEVVGMTLPVPVKFLPETEALIRRERTKLPPTSELPRGTMTRLAEAGWIGAAYTPSAQDTGLLRLKAKVEQVLQLPPAFQRQAIQADPELQAYLDWARAQPPWASKSPERYWYSTR